MHSLQRKAEREVLIVREQGEKEEEENGEKEGKEEKEGKVGCQHAV